MQNRGQLAAGMTSYIPDRSALLEDAQGAGDGRRGVPPQPSRRSSRRSCRGTTARPPSATSATPPAAATTASYAQPFEREHGRKAKWFAFAFNGQLANYQELKRRAARAGRLPPEARHRHRDHHALAELRAPGRGTGDRLAWGLQPPGREVRRRLQHRPARRPAATWSWPATRWASGRSASPSTARSSPRPARASRWPTSASRNIRSLEPGTLAVANQRRRPDRAVRRRRRGRRTASSSGSTSPTSPARSTTARST